MTRRALIKWTDCGTSIEGSSGNDPMALATAWHKLRAHAGQAEQLNGI
jgi:hypothetical protein